MYPKARTYVLDGFRVCPNRWVRESMIHQWVKDSSPTKIPPDAIRDAVQWQVSQGRLEHRVDPESEESEWRLTEDGKEHLRVN